jgi:hypothetical protein
MKDTKKPKKQASARKDGVEREGAEFTPHAHLIRLADQEARRRAIMVLGEARQPYSGFADHCFLVTDEHLGILRREAIPFELVS